MWKCMWPPVISLSTLFCLRHKYCSRWMPNFCSVCQWAVSLCSIFFWVSVFICHYDNISICFACKIIIVRACQANCWSAVWVPLWRFYSHGIWEYESKVWKVISNLFVGCFASLTWGEFWYYSFVYSFSIFNFEFWIFSTFCLCKFLIQFSTVQAKFLLWEQNPFYSGFKFSRDFKFFDWIV